MASGKEIRAGGAFIELFTKDGALVKGLARAQSRLKAFGAGMTSIGTKMAAIGASITAPMLLAAKSAASSGAEFYDMSRRTGLSVEALSKLSYAADRSGTDINTVEGAIRKMQKTVVGVADALEGTTGNLGELGLEAQKLVDASPEEQFNIIAAKIAAIEHPSLRAAAAMKVFGRSGTAVLPLIEDLAELEKRQKKLGIVKSTGQAKEQKELDNLFKDSASVLKSFWGSIASAVLPVLKEKEARIIKLTVAVRNWMRDNKALIGSIFKIATLVGVAGSAMVVFGKAVSVVAPVLGLIGTAISVIASPIGAVSVALAGLAAYFLFATETGGKMVNWLTGKLRELQATVGVAVSGMADALAAGDIKLAAQILWVGLQAAWAEGTHALQEKWIGFKATMIKVAIEGFYSVLDTWAIVSADLQAGVASAASFFREAWEDAVSAVTGVLEKFYVEKATMAEKDRISAAIDKEQHRAGGPRQYVLDTLNRQLGGVDQHADQVVAARKASEDAASKEREAQLQAKLIAIKAERDKQLAGNVDAEQGLKGGLAASTSTELADLDKRKKELEAELAALRAKAAVERKTANAPEPTGPDAPPRPTVGDFQDAVAESKTTVAARGTFNAAAVQGLQNPSKVHEQQLEEQKKATKSLKKIEGKLPPAFA